jgi:hypothetical protein
MSQTVQGQDKNRFFDYVSFISEIPFYGLSSHKDTPCIHLPSSFSFYSNENDGLLHADCQVIFAFLYCNPFYYLAYYLSKSHNIEYEQLH